MTDTTDGAVRCVVYAAKSTADKHGSIDSQIEACRVYAERLGWQVAEPTYSDEAASAYSGSRGPGLVAAKVRAAALAAEGSEVVLLVYATDRLARGDGKHAAHLVEHVLAALKDGYRIESATENMGGDLALVLASIYGERAHADSKAKGAHVKRGLRRRVQGGHHPGGVTPYGYTYQRDRNDLNDLGRLVPVPEQAAVVRRMYREYVGGAGYRTIQVALNDEGIPSPRGTLWDHSQVAHILNNPVYKGCLRLNDEEHEGSHPALVEVPVWERAQLLRQARRASTAAGRLPAGPHLLTHGLLRCGVCGAAMRPRRHRGEWYACSRRETTGGWRKCTMGRVPRAAVDQALLDHFDGMVFDLDATRAQIAVAHSGRLAEVRQLREGYQATLENIGRERDRNLSDYRRNALKAERYTWLEEQLDMEQAVAEDNLAGLVEAEHNIEAEAALVDVEGEVLGRLALLRQVVAGTVHDAEGLAGLRAALATTFERIELVPGADGDHGVLGDTEDGDFSLRCHVRLEALPQGLPTMGEPPLRLPHCVPLLSSLFGPIPVQR